MNKELLKILACPKCKGDLNHIKTNLNCKKCKVNYKIKEGIPIFV